MKVEELQNIAIRLANDNFCRYWTNVEGSDGLTYMWIQIRDFDGKPLEVEGMERLGFEEGHNFFYKIKKS